MTSAIKWPCLCDPSFLLHKVVDLRLNKLKHHQCLLPDSGYAHCGIWQTRHSGRSTGYSRRGCVL